MLALRKYLLFYGFRSASTPDLWAEVDKQLPGAGTEVMAWSTRGGFPVVTVHSAGDGELEVVQKVVVGGEVVECGVDGAEPWPVSLQEARSGGKGGWGFAGVGRGVR